MSRATRFAVLFLSCGAAFALGLLASMLGPVIPDLASRMGSSLAATASLFTALFVGALPAQLATGPLNDRFGPRILLASGLALVALGLLATTLSTTLWLALASMLVAGVGDGILVVAVNVVVAEVFASRAVVALNISGVFFGLGAASGPALAAYSLQTWQSGLPALWLLVAVLVLLIVFVLPLRLRKSSAQVESRAAGMVDRAGAISLAPSGGSLYRSPLLWLLAFLLVLYVGTEMGTGNWTLAYVSRTTSLQVGAAALVASGFWLALTAGRVVGALLGTRLSARALLGVSLSGAGLGALLYLLSRGSVPLTVLSVGVMGLFLGPVYPTMVAYTTFNFRQNAARAAGLVMSMGSLGGMLLPWLDGVLIEQVDPSGFTGVLFASLLGMVTLYLLLRILVPSERRVRQARELHELAEPTLAE